MAIKIHYVCRVCRCRKSFGEMKDSRICTSCNYLNQPKSRCPKCGVEKNTNEFRNNLCASCAERKERAKTDHKSKKGFRKGSEEEDRHLSITEEAKRECLERAQLLGTLGFNSYSQYIESQLWLNIKNAVFNEKGRNCVVCGCQPYTVHHRKYTLDNLQGKSTEYLEPICFLCHRNIEFNGRQKIGARFVDAKLEDLIARYKRSPLDINIRQKQNNESLAKWRKLLHTYKEREYYRLD